MAPRAKKAATNGEANVNDEGEGGSFRWTLENERKLLILTQGRYLTGEDYERLLTVFPGTNLNGVKIRVSRLRVQQRNLYEEYGWQLPEGGATKKRAAPAKNDATEDDNIKKSAKKPPKKPKKAEQVEQAEKIMKDDGSETDFLPHEGETKNEDELLVDL